MLVRAIRPEGLAAAEDEVLPLVLAGLRLSSLTPSCLIIDGRFRPLPFIRAAQDRPFTFRLEAHRNLTHAESYVGSLRTFLARPRMECE
jgi:hypothetical protein